MEEELRCLACKHLFEKPVLLPCGHALCLTCALGLQQPVAGSEADSVTSSSSGDYTEADKVSILSETDSGVVCGSRPSSYVGSSNINGAIFPPTALFLTCPICQKPVYFDENGANNLPKYRVMQRIIDKFGDGSTIHSESVYNCQMCEEDPPKAASVHCEQCSVLYCDPCRESCHPSRGPLSRHTLVLAGRLGSGTGCAEHGGAPLVAHCTPCRLPACSRCLQERHVAHDVQQLTIACKTQKTELSQNLQLLSEKALAMTEYIQRVKTLADKVNESYTDFENIVTVQCEALIEAIRMRRESLLQSIRDDRDGRVRDMKDQAAMCTRRLQSATGLLQFCIEALKETESAAFLQVGSLLAGRAAGVGVECARILQAAPRPPPPRPDLTLDDRPLLSAINHLNFIQMKPAVNGENRQPAAPGAPGLAPELCAAENNSVTVAWVPPIHSHVEGYVLELDDGHGGDFREVYCGRETMCTVDGLHFNSLYNARVKAFNATGEGIYSELIGLQTAPVAWFSWEGGGRPDGLSLYGSGLGTRVAGWEHRVALAGVGLSRGVHYWRLIVDRYDADTDPAFGIARADVSRDKMLGKDNSGWAMYIDGSRSWFQHGGAHHSRQEGGISAGSEVGVLLDLDSHTLRFTVDGLSQGGIAFTDLYGVFYPAVSLNRGVAVTLCPALEPPSDLDEP